MSESLNHHRAAEELASKAELSKSEEERRHLYAEAAANEELALGTVDETHHSRTFGVIGVNAASLFYRAQEYSKAEEIALRLVQTSSLPDFARTQLKYLIQEIWSAQSAITSLNPNHPVIEVALRGEAIGYGLAPLDVVMSKLDSIQKLVYRTAEYLGNRTFRARGPVPLDIKQACQPFMSQPLPGSYRFYIQLQSFESVENVLNVSSPEPTEVASKLMAVLSVISKGPSQDDLNVQVVEPRYRDTLVKLVRNLVPTGEDIDEIEFRYDSSGLPITTIFTKATMSIIKDLLEPQALLDSKGLGMRGTLVGTLRAPHLDEFWLELTLDDGQRQRCDIHGLLLDDIVGPMVNHRVAAVGFWQDLTKRKFVVSDIQPVSSF